MNTLGTLLKNKRIELKLSLRKAASLIGISHTYLNILETGIDPRNKSAINPTPETLKLISKAYNIDYDYLMNIVGYTDSESINLVKSQKAKSLQEDLLDILVKHNLIHDKNIDDNTLAGIEKYILFYLQENNNKK